MTDFYEKPQVALIGNPNCGKTTLFNRITGLNQKTGNWPGVTVNSRYCSVNYDQLDYHLIDLPGIYALSVESSGQDELHVQEFLINNKPDLIINVINASALERGLFMALELKKFGCPIVTVLNMWDDLSAKNISIDTQTLSKLLNSPVIKTVAKNSKDLGVEELKQTIKTQLKNNCTVQKQQQKQDQLRPLDIDTGDSDIFNQRLEQAKNISKQVTTRPKGNFIHKNRKLDFLTTHPVWGMFSFLLAMYVMFFFAINVSAVFIDFFDIATGALLIDGGHRALESIGLPQWLVVIIADGVGGGLQTVATFIPVIGFLYLILTWLEDSGYMARAAFVMNGLMQKIGLSGQAFVPLIVSFGCNVPAIMATRTLATKRERLVTVMMAPFMSCGARLSVYALFVAAFFSDYASFIVLVLYLIGILMAILTGLMLQKTILPGKAEPFIIELPPWRLPSLRNLLMGTWYRLKGFLLDAGKIIVIMVMLIQVLNSIGSDFTWGNEDSENSMLSVASKSVVPIFEPMGIEEKNWPAIVGILTGILAKEVVVGTLDALYTSLEKEQNASQDNPPEIKQQLKEAVVSIKDNALELSHTLLDPLGLSIVSKGSDEQMASNQDVSDSLFGIIRDRFSDKYAAFAYLLFILLYFPCVAATAAVAREAGMKWAVFTAGWSTGLAYMSAVCFYQFSQFSQNPLAALIWLSIYVTGVSSVFLYLKRIGKRAEPIKLNIV
ncbi:MAG: ferrous iron transport protein B [Marinicellaceae bacterium]